MFACESLDVPLAVARGITREFFAVRESQGNHGENRCLAGTCMRVRKEEGEEEDDEEEREEEEEAEEQEQKSGRSTKQEEEIAIEAQETSQVSA